jgi:DNA-binding Lrp family transcriptional regulator
MDVTSSEARLGDRRPWSLDATDRRILVLLCEDARMSIRTVAERAGVSRSGAYSRLERLRAAGVIVGYEARLSPVRIGLQVTAHVFVTLDQGVVSDAIEQVRAIPEVVYCATMAADYDVFLMLRAASMETVRRVVVGELQRLPAVLRTRTSLVLEEHTDSDAGLLALLSTDETTRTTTGPPHLVAGGAPRPPRRSHVPAGTTPS